MGGASESAGALREREGRREAVIADIGKVTDDDERSEDERMMRYSMKLVTRVRYAACHGKRIERCR